MNGERFGQWLLRNIPFFKSHACDNPVVLVLDNAPYHSIITNKTPRKNARKQEMIDFIEENGFSTPNGATKSILYEIIQNIIKANPKKFDQKVAEEICLENGIEVKISILKFTARGAAKRLIELKFPLISRKPGRK